MRVTRGVGVNATSKWLWSHSGSVQSSISFEMALKIFAQFDDEHDLTRTHPPFDYLLVQNYSVLLARGHYRAS